MAVEVLLIGEGGEEPLELALEEEGARLIGAYTRRGEQILIRTLRTLHPALLKTLMNLCLKWIKMRGSASRLRKSEQNPREP